MKGSRLLIRNKSYQDFWPRERRKRHTVPPCTTKRATTNLKTKSNQNYRKIKLYGSLTTKELKKKHSPRQVEAVEIAAGAERTCRKGVAGVAGGPTFPHG